MIALLAIGCGAVSTGGLSPSPTPLGSPLNIYVLKFRLIQVVGVPAYCDPDQYPVAREGGELANAIATYPQIRAKPDLYAAIIAHENLPADNLTDDQKVTVYQDYKLLNSLAFTSSGTSYSFRYLVKSTSGPSYMSVSGTVRVDGLITVSGRTTSGPPMCPICLAAATMIATPDGPVRVTELKKGVQVWTVSGDGKRVAAPIVEVGSMAVPAGHQMVHLRLADGRELLASPGHRTADGRALGSLAVGDALDGSIVRLWELVPYGGSRTYDIKPAGPTGTYWANGILLSSTL